MTDLRAKAERLLAGITPGEWYAADMPPNGWTVFWCPDGPICHMRWTDGMRPEVNARLEFEAKFIAAAPRLIRGLLDELARLTAERDAAREQFDRHVVWASNQAATLEADLRTYGGHKRDCSYGRHIPGRGDPNEDCSCGWSARLAES